MDKNILDVFRYVIDETIRHGKSEISRQTIIREDCSCHSEHYIDTTRNLLEKCGYLKKATNASGKIVLGLFSIEGCKQIPHDMKTHELKREYNEHWEKM